MSAEALHHVVSSPGMHEVLALANLSVVILIFVIVGRKGIRATLTDRSSQISKDLVEARHELEKTKALIQETKRNLNDISRDREKLLAETRIQGEALSAQILADAKSTADRILVDAKNAATNELSNATETFEKMLIKRALEESLLLLSQEELRVTVHNRLVERVAQEAVNLKGQNGRT